MYKFIATISVLFKFLFLKFYVSTDFKVHENWLYVTRQNHISKWYTENSTIHTLDYPLFFAYFEYALSYPFFLLKVFFHPFNQDFTLVYNKITVIVSELLLVYYLYKFIHSHKQKSEIKKNFFMLLTYNFGIILVDHIHFQYNGFIHGLLFASLFYVCQDRPIIGSVVFLILINMKHLFLVLGPSYFVYLFFGYCINRENRYFLKFSKRIFQLITVTLGIMSLGLGPLLYYEVFGAFLKRLFPFGRGLTHAYWAPNFWAIYNFIDRYLIWWHKSSNPLLKPSSTSGLVGEINHVILPSINPMGTMFITICTMLPCLVKLAICCLKKGYSDKISKQLFFSSIIISSWSYFIFGWHVHEKAVLTFLLVLNLYTFLFDIQLTGLTFYVNTVAHFSLTPLIFTPEEQLPVWTMFLTWTMLNSVYGDLLKGQILMEIKLERKSNLSLLFERFFKLSQNIHLCGLPVVFLLSKILLPLFKPKMEFLPLGLISVYCSFGIIQSFIYFYVKFFRVKI